MANKELEIEKLKFGEIDKKTFMKRTSCSDAEVDEELSKLENSNKEILTSYPVEKMKVAIEAKINSKKNKKIIPFKQKIISYILIAAAVLLLAVLLPYQNIKNKHSTFNKDNLTLAENSSIRVKGSDSPKLFLYKYESEGAVRLENNSHVNCGDVIQISYVAGKAKNGMIFSIDGSGVLTQHFPEQKSVSGKLEKGKETALDFSYKLDDAPKFEKFYFITGDSEFTIDDLKISMNTGDVDSLKNKKLNIESFYLEK